MQTLTIKDLSVTEQLDSRAMRAVRGGTLGFGNSYFNFSPTTLTDMSKTLNVMQGNSTTVGVMAEVGNNALLSGGNVNSNPVVYNGNGVFA